MDSPVNLINLNREDLATFFVDLGEKPFRANQVLQWIHQRGITDFDAMTNLSKSLRQRLQTTAYIAFPKVINTHVSADGTRKWVLQLDSGNCIETVFIPEDDRGTLCVSSQVGCALDCTFCATAQQGFNRNLTVGEIVAQLWLVEHALKTHMSDGLRLPASTGDAEERMTNAEEAFSLRAVSNVVLMGMGEPLANFNNVVKAIQLMMDDFAFGLSWRRITLSTAGIVPAIARLKEHCPVHLAISLHAPTDELRNQLVPLNRKYPLAELLAACRAYFTGKNRHKITFEYVMLKDINDTPSHAKALIKLLQGIPAKVNLIPFNPFPQSHYQRSLPESIERFRDLLIQAGLVTVTRKTRGDDISAACGQLAGKVLNRKRQQPVTSVEFPVNVVPRTAMPR